MPDFLSFFSGAFVTGSKSTTLRPLAWLIGMLLSGTIAAVHYQAPEWLVLMLGVAAGIVVLIYLIAYIYFAFTDKDCLRSERYSIQKLAIQHGLVGDSATGLFRVVTDPSSESSLSEPKSLTQSVHE